MSNQIKFKCKALVSERERIPASDEFIERNNLKLFRTTDELFKKISLCRQSAFDFQGEVLLDYLPWEKAKHLCGEEYVSKVDAGSEEKPKQITDIRETVQDFLDYMVFAWGKAEGERGLSASRSIDKLSAWLWLFGREDLEETIRRDDLYQPYGAPALITVCEDLGISAPESLYEFAGLREKELNK